MTTDSASFHRPFVILTARLFALLAVIFFQPGCRIVSPSKPASPASPPAVLATGALIPSPRLIVGRILTLDPAQGFAFVELAPDAPTAALVNGTELITRTLDLRETARLRASRYISGRTLGTKIVDGQPTPGDEVVWLAP